MIAQGASKWDAEPVQDGDLRIGPGDVGILKVGKRRFLKLID